jgi:hypothetical protein
MPDGMLCQLYPVFLNRRLDHIKNTLPWDPDNNEAVIAAMDQRRKSILDKNAKALAHYRTLHSH